MWKWLFGFSGASLGALAGLAASIFFVLACSAVAGISDTGLLLALGLVVVGTVGGGVLGAYLGGKAGPPKS